MKELGYIMTFSAPVLAIASFFKDSVVTRTEWLAAGVVLFMIGDVLLLIDAALGGWGE